MGHPDCGGNADVRQVHRIDAARPDLLDERRIAAPEADVMPHASEVHRQRGTPAACTENRDRTHYARTPRRGSVPIRSRPRFVRWRKRMSTDAQHAAATASAGAAVA